MRSLRRKSINGIIILLASLVCIFALAGHVYAQVTVNILAVNGTEKEKERDIKEFLPKELGRDDILDTDGLNVEYDTNQGAYVVSGVVKLAPKESKTYKIRVQDVWVINDEEVANIKKQITAGVAKVKDTEFSKIAEEKETELLRRLDYIVSQQEQFADNIEKRIDRFRIYHDELVAIKDNAVSIDYWKSLPPKPEEGKLIRFIIETKNPSNKPKKYQHKHYLPQEVKPEHIYESQDFDFRFDGVKNLPYLSKEEELAAEETKQYQISVLDVWNIAQQEIDNIKNQTRDVYRLLEKTEYQELANYLVGNIKSNLERIEASQNEEKNIYDHISAYRVNKKYFEQAEKDLQALLNLLRALRENLERSKLKNVLQKLKSLKSIADIARSIFKRPEINTAWKIIAGVVIFVGLLTFIHFTIWSKRSKEVKLENKKEEAQKENKTT